jgi:hypothetical protein
MLALPARRHRRRGSSWRTVIWSRSNLLADREAGVGSSPRPADLCLAHSLLAASDY